MAASTAITSTSSTTKFAESCQLQRPARFSKPGRSDLCFTLPFSVPRCYVESLGSETFLITSLSHWYLPRDICARPVWAGLPYRIDIRKWNRSVQGWALDKVHFCLNSWADPLILPELELRQQSPIAFSLPPTGKIFGLNRLSAYPSPMKPVRIHWDRPLSAELP